MEHAPEIVTSSTQDLHVGRKVDFSRVGTGTLLKLLIEKGDNTRLKRRDGADIYSQVEGREREPPEEAKDACEARRKSLTALCAWILRPSTMKVTSAKSSDPKSLPGR